MVMMGRIQARQQVGHAGRFEQAVEGRARQRQATEVGGGEHAVQVVEGVFGE